MRRKSTLVLTVLLLDAGLALAQAPAEPPSTPAAPSGLGAQLLPPVPPTDKGSPTPTPAPASKGQAPAINGQKTASPSPTTTPTVAAAAPVWMTTPFVTAASVTCGGAIPPQGSGCSPAPVDLGPSHPETNFQLSADYLLWTVRGGVPVDVRNVITGAGFNADAALHGLPMDNWESGLRVFGKWSPGDNCWPTLEVGAFALAIDRGSYDATLHSFPGLNSSLVPNQLFLQPTVNDVIDVPKSRGIIDGAQLDATGMLTSHLVTASQRQLWGMEANIRSDPIYFGTVRWDWLAGFRNVNLRERLGVYGDFTFRQEDDNNIGAMQTYDRIEDQTNFYGGQVGFSFETRVTEGLTFGGFCKVALGSNVEKVSQVGYTVLDPTSFELSPGGLVVLRPAKVVAGGLFTAQVPYGIETRSSHFGVLPELNLNFGYQFNTHWQAFFGLDYFYLSNVARLGGSTPVVGATGQGNLAMYGVDFGLQYRY